MNLDSRNILVDAIGDISLSRVAIGRGETLCSYCPNKDLGCPFMVEKPIAKCPAFTLGLAFAPPLLGFEGPFSTLRSSSIWHDRIKAIEALKTGKRVHLFNAATQTPFATASVAWLVRGRFKEIMEKTAHTNHLCLAAGIPKDDAPEWLAKKIRNLAGPRYIKSPDQICTVIYLDPS